MMRSQMIEFLKTFDSIYERNDSPGIYHLSTLFRRLYDNLLIKIDLSEKQFIFEKEFFEDYYDELASRLIDMGFIRHIELPDRHDDNPEQFQYYVVTQAGYDLMDKCFEFEAFDELEKEYDEKYQILQETIIEEPKYLFENLDWIEADLNNGIRRLLYKNLGA